MLSVKSLSSLSILVSVLTLGAYAGAGAGAGTYAGAGAGAYAGTGAGDGAYAGPPTYNIVHAR